MASDHEAFLQLSAEGHIAGRIKSAQNGLATGINFYDYLSKPSNGLLSGKLTGSLGSTTAVHSVIKICKSPFGAPFKPFLLRTPRQS